MAPRKKKPAAPKVAMWALDKLVPYDRNPRKNDHAVDDVAAAIREYGFRVPVLAKSDGTIVDGHLRYKAAQKLELDAVPVMLCDDMTDAQIKAFRISVNRMADKADWDFELLKIDVDELADADFDLDLIGFDADERDTFLFGTEEPGEGTGSGDGGGGDGSELQRITFTLHDDQVRELERALDASKDMGPFGDTGNDDTEGNALARIAELFVGNFGGPSK